MKVLLRKLSVLLALVVCTGAVPTTAAAGHPSKLDKALRAASLEAPRPQRVIIQAAPGARVELKRALQAHGDRVEAEHPSLEALTVTVHGEDLAGLDRDPKVARVSLDAEVTSFAARSAIKRRPEDILRATLGIESLMISGFGVNVAIVDSGIAPNRDLNFSIEGFWDFTRGGIPARAYDDYGHGTHVAGLIASSGSESKREFMGVAPGAKLYGFKVLDRNGRGRASDVIRALEFIIANHRAGIFRVDVINLSLGHPIYEPATTDPLVRTVEKAVRAGIVVVTAAGNVGADRDLNTGYAGITSPGNAPSAITVGASDTKATTSVADDRVAYFSSRGPTWFDGYAKPDVVAPGVGLTSNAPKVATLYTKYPQLKSTGGSGDNSFATLSGTSMSTAVTSGVVALMLQANRTTNRYGNGLSPNAVKALLQYTAFTLSDDAGVPYDALAQGAGHINPLGALAMATHIDTGVPVGQSWLRTPVAPFTTLHGQTIPWSRNLIWDDVLINNSNALAFNGEQWGENIVWGSNYGCDSLDGACENIVWGSALDCDGDLSCENIVWGSSADFENIVWGSVSLWANDIVWKNRIVGLMTDDENIVWGSFAGLTDENIVWGTFDGENIVWGSFAADGENIVWGSDDAENIVWGSFSVTDENIVWGSLDDENIVWGSLVTEKGGR